VGCRQEGRKRLAGNHPAGDAEIAGAERWVENGWASVPSTAFSAFEPPGLQAVPGRGSAGAALGQVAGLGGKVLSQGRIARQISSGKR